MRPASTLLCLVIVAGCSTSMPPAASPSPAPSPPAASFELDVDAGSLKGSYASQSSAPLSICRTPASGPWSFQYAGGSPFMTIDLTLRDGAASTPGSTQFDMTIEGGMSIHLWQSGEMAGIQGRGTATVERNGSASLVRIEGEGRGWRDGADVGAVPLRLSLRC